MYLEVKFICVSIFVPVVAKSLCSCWLCLSASGGQVCHCVVVVKSTSSLGSSLKGFSGQVSLCAGGGEICVQVVVKHATTSGHPSLAPLIRWQLTEFNGLTQR